MNHELSPGGLLVRNTDVRLEAPGADTPAEYFQFNVHNFTLNKKSECVNGCKRCFQVQSLSSDTFCSDVPKCSDSVDLNKKFNKMKLWWNKKTFDVFRHCHLEIKMFNEYV